MDFNVLSTQNWSRMFNVWIEDIQVIALPAAMAPLQLRRCVLSRVRTYARYGALLVVLLFSLHCTGPRFTSSARQAPEPPSPEPEIGPRVYVEQGEASWYGGNGDGFAGEVTANGEIYDPGALTCAHRTLPFGTLVEVENLGNGRRVILRVNDRGPFARGRILDMSKRAAKELDLLQPGVATISLRTVDAQGRPQAMDPSVLLGNPYTIQVAALADPANVERLSRELRASFGPVTFRPAMGPGGVSMQRIRVGNYQRLEQAQQATQEIAKFCKDRGLVSFITREN